MFILRSSLLISFTRGVCGECLSDIRLVPENCRVSKVVKAEVRVQEPCITHTQSYRFFTNAYKILTQTMYYVIA